jgi:hypothetical protein
MEKIFCFIKAGGYMKRTILAQKILFRIIIFFFTVNISFCVLPGGIAYSYGLFGEMTSLSVAENQNNVIQSNPIKYNVNQQNKTIINREQRKAQYAWLLMIILLSVYHLRCWLTASNYVTPVILKVRMNH